MLGAASARTSAGRSSTSTTASTRTPACRAASWKRPSRSTWRSGGTRPTGSRVRASTRRCWSRCTGARCRSCGPPRAARTTGPLEEHIAAERSGRRYCRSGSACLRLRRSGPAARCGRGTVCRWRCAWTGAPSPSRTCPRAGAASISSCATRRRSVGRGPVAVRGRVGARALRGAAARGWLPRSARAARGFAAARPVRLENVLERPETRSPRLRPAPTTRAAAGAQPAGDFHLQDVGRCPAEGGREEFGRWWRFAAGDPRRLAGAAGVLRKFCLRLGGVRGLDDRGAASTPAWRRCGSGSPTICAARPRDPTSRRRRSALCPGCRTSGRPSRTHDARDPPRRLGARWTAATGASWRPGQDERLLGRADMAPSGRSGTCREPGDDAPDRAGLEAARPLVPAS